MTSLSENEDEETPLQRKLNSVANDISIIGLVCAIIAVVAMYIRFGAEIGSGTSEWSDEEGPSELVDFFIVGITVLVVAIPEGLPLAVTISLAYSVQKM
jgi:magnesium-transporting ATPase (P-type)